MAPWIKCKTTGVRYRLHTSRKHGVGFDKYFTIRYKVAGKEKSEALGWSSEGWTEKKAGAILAELKANHTKGEGPRSLEEKRKLESDRLEDIHRQEREATEAKEQEKALIYDNVFRDYREANDHKASLKDEIGYHNNWISPVIGQKMLNQIVLFDLERIRASMVKAGNAPRSIQYIKSIVRQVYHFAVEHGKYSGEIPTINFLKKQKIDNKRKKYLTVEEAEALLDRVREYSKKTYQITLLSLHTGMRFGEIAALRWQHINTDSREIIVIDPKNGESRHVFMTERIQTMFQGMTQGRPDEIVFPDNKGGIRGRVSNSFARAVDDLKINEGITDRRMKFVFHSVRHSCASILVNQGVSIPVIAQILGHKTLAMTMRYSHINNDSVKNAMAILDEKPQQEAEKIIPLIQKAG